MCVLISLNVRSDIKYTDGRGSTQGNKEINALVVKFWQVKSYVQIHQNISIEEGNF